MEVNSIEKKITKLKKIIDKYFKKNDLEKCLKNLRILSNFLYVTNYCFYDCFSENMVLNISLKIFKNEIFIKNPSETVVFYDGFSLLNRGLMKIYLNALSKMRKVIYIATSDNDSIKKYLDSIDVGYIILQNKKDCDKIKELAKVITEIKPSIFFNYTKPDDVVSCAVMSVVKGDLKRVLINLTDHAYWLGASHLDYSIEFRDYGATISKQFRNIPTHKIIKIPFFPNLNENIKFKGFPFEYKKDNVVVFSGGSIYKTLDKKLTYYKLVENLLSAHKNLIFWYAGSGNEKYINKIIKKYPNRCYLTSERDDLYQILLHSTFYLSTYPVCGGLMYQYAAKAGKVPLTLLHSDISSDFLLNQDRLNVDFHSENKLLNEANKLINNIEYRNKRSIEMLKSVTSKEEFESNLAKFIKFYKTPLIINYKKYNFQSLKKTYLQNFKYIDYCKLIAQKDNLFLLKNYFFEFSLGSFLKIYSKIIKKGS